MIKSFRDGDAEALYRGEFVRRLQGVAVLAHRKLDMIDAAEKVQDLKSPPGNRLETLGGSRKGLFSIRINDQWRICFAWTEDGAENVEIVDYH